jgi:hypothetical protein
MNGIPEVVLKRIVYLALVVSCSVAADSTQIDAALKQYYAGYPGVAIDMLEPLASSGELDAQYTLGNMLYSLAGSDSPFSVEDAVEWYQKAAAQDSADANYALGAIFHNRWLETRKDKDAATAIIYYQNAVELKLSKAWQPLEKLKSRSGISADNAAALSLIGAPAAVSIDSPETGPPPAETSKRESSDGQSSADEAQTSDKPAVKEAVLADSNTRPAAAPEAQDGDIADDAAPTVIDLGEIADSCGRYTQTGYKLFAETIRGNAFRGQASMVAIRRDSSNSANFAINLKSDQFGTPVFIDLSDVPREVANRFRKGRSYEINGIVVDSKADDETCTVNLKYRSI